MTDRRYQTSLRPAIGGDRKMSDRNTNEIEQDKQVLGSYTEAWSSRVINSLITEFTTGQSMMPVGFRMKGINMTTKGDEFVIGFVVTKEKN